MTSSSDILHLSSFYPKDSVITKVIESENQIDVYLKSKTHEQDCPACGQNSSKFHSTYKRKLQDLPILGKATYVYLTAYQYECENQNCSQHIFCEELNDFTGYYKRMTRRLEDFLVTLALNTSCEGAARICKLIGIKTSGDTIIRILIERASHFKTEQTDFIGVDDWSYKKGQTYGTIIVDGKTHKPIDLLHGRDGAELKKWLKNNKQIKIVTRDRASAYATAIKEILPDAMQVADRFHLHQNFLECIQKVMQQYIPEKIRIEDEDINQDVKKKKTEIKITKKHKIK